MAFDWNKAEYPEITDDLIEGCLEHYIYSYKEASAIESKTSQYSKRYQSLLKARAGMNKFVSEWGKLFQLDKETVFLHFSSDTLNLMSKGIDSTEHLKYGSYEYTCFNHEKIEDSFFTMVQSFQRELDLFMDGETLRHEVDEDTSNTYAKKKLVQFLLNYLYKYFNIKPTYVLKANKHRVTKSNIPEIALWIEKVFLAIPAKQTLSKGKECKEALLLIHQDRNGLHSTVCDGCKAFPSFW